MTWQVGVDVGGTFTDVVARGPDGEVRRAKVPSTPSDQSTGILAGVDRGDVELGAVTRFAHGTTVGTNTVLERDGADTVLVTTAGFRGVLEIGRQDRPSLYDPLVDRPEPLVARGRIVEADERVGVTPDGACEVVTPLTADEATRVAAAVRELAPEAVAVSLLFSFDDPSHEQALRAALGDDLPVSLSSDVLPTFREFERTSTTVLNAYVAPRMRRYLDNLRHRLRDAGLDAPVEVMRSAGGTFLAEVAAEQPVQTLLSGPAAGAWGAAAAAVASGTTDVIGLDMGGTSTDVTLITDGRPRTTADGAINGLPFAVPTTDIHTVGSGGGSIAWVDAGGALRVGPRSAGADPGPAAYGRGGTRATVTDANVVLGRLDPDAALGGDLRLDVDAARRAMTALAAEVGLDVEATAAGIVRIVEAQMAAALRVVSVERGHDPRRFTLMPFGGAGPLHQAGLARELGVRDVLVPANPGLLCAEGLLAAPIAVDVVRTNLRSLDALDAAGLAQRWDALIADGERRLRRQGAEPDSVARAVDLRYHGQGFELTVEAAAGTAPADLLQPFHRLHDERYGYAQPDAPVELVNVRVRVEAAPPAAGAMRPRGGGAADDARLTTRPSTDPETPGTITVYDRDRLGVGARLRGPAILVGLDSTVHVAAWQQGEVDETGALRLMEVSA